jgi:thiosulfate/3-mercaptopyruvate sulfurtransferase
MGSDPENAIFRVQLHFQGQTPIFKNMKLTCIRSLVSSISPILFLCLFFIDSGAMRSGKSQAAGQSGETGPSLIQPQDLVSILKSTEGPKPLLIQVGFHVLYVQAHIPGSEFIGPASSPEVIRRLRKRLESLPRTQTIVLYCGCCPWNDCPNLKPAYRELGAMGFKSVKLLYIARYFGEDWVAKNYPVAKGE